MVNGTTLTIKVDDKVKYSDVVSGGEGMAMLLRLSGGKDAKMEPPFMIFKNKVRNYPIWGTLDNIPIVAYCTGTKGCIHRNSLSQWLLGRRVMCSLPNGRKCVFFLDDGSEHNHTEEQMRALCSITTGARAEVMTGTAVYGAHVGGCAHVWPARARTVA